MRMTIHIDEQLLEEAKQLAARTGKSLASIIEDALRESLSQQRGSGQREPVSLVTLSGNALLPSVDLDNSAALLDVMEASDDPPWC